MKKIQEKIYLFFITLCVSSNVFAAYCNKNINDRWWEHCQKHCGYNLGQDSCDQGTPFTNCLNSCIQECETFGSYEGVYCKGN